MEARIVPMIVPVTALRPRLLRCLNRASRLGEEYIITRNGKPSAVIVGFDEWESWKETRDILSDPSVLRRIQKAQRYFSRGGKGKTISETFGR